MRGLQGSGWLLIGAVLGILVPVTGMHRVVVDALQGLLALPWSGILVGVLVFGTCAGLYFRAHWAAAATAHRDHARHAADAAERVGRIGDEIERAAFLISDNLREVAGASGSRRDLYLEGARAHADRLRSVASRCRGVASRFVPTEDASDGAGSEPES